MVRYYALFTMIPIDLPLNAFVLCLDNTYYMSKEYINLP